MLGLGVRRGGELGVLVRQRWLHWLHGVRRELLGMELGAALG
jgi:hypothetical protein